MAAVIVDISKMVVTQIAAATLSESVTAARAKTVRHELKDLTTAMVDVVPKSRQNRASSGSRNRVFAEFSVHVGIHKRVTNEAAEDAVLLLADEIDALFRKQSFTTEDGRTVAWVDSGYDAVYSPDHLEQKQTLAVVSTLVFGVSL